VGVASLDEVERRIRGGCELGRFSNDVSPRSITLVHRPRHAQGDGDEERERARRTVDASRTRGERGCGGGVSEMESPGPRNSGSGDIGYGFVDLRGPRRNIGGPRLE